MRLKTTTKDACDASDASKEQLLRRGFEPWNNTQWLRLCGDKPGEVYEAWFPHGYRRGEFVRIYKGTVGGSKTISGVDWDFSNKIILRLE